MYAQGYEWKVVNINIVKPFSVNADALKYTYEQST